MESKATKSNTFQLCRSHVGQIQKKYENKFIYFYFGCRPLKPSRLLFIVLESTELTSHFYTMSSNLGHRFPSGLFLIESPSISALILEPCYRLPKSAHFSFLLVIFFVINGRQKKFKSFHCIVACIRHFVDHVTSQYCIRYIFIYFKTFRSTTSIINSSTFDFEYEYINKRVYMYVKFQLSVV